MTIAPPDLVPQQKSSVEVKESLYWKPSMLEPSSHDDFRLMGTYSSGHTVTGWQYPIEVKGDDGNLRFGGFKVSKDHPGKEPEGIARKTNWELPDRPKIDGEYEKVKGFVAWVALSISRKRLEVLMIEQLGIREKLGMILSQEEDFTFSEDGVANFTLRFSRTGNKLNTRYEVLPMVKAAPESLRKKWTKESDSIWLPNFFIGEDPFDGKKTDEKGLPAGGTDNNGATVVAKGKPSVDDSEDF
jgi:hypothetical protein